MKRQYVFAVSGVKNSGKTHLISDLIRHFREKGMTVSVIKHDGHDFEPDVPDTDSFLVRKAGAEGVAVFSGNRMMIIKERPVASEKELIRAFPESDLIILEGFKHSEYPKIEVIRKENSRTPVCDAAWLIGIVTDLEREELPAEYQETVLYGFDQCGQLAEDLMARHAGGKSPKEVKP